MWDSYKDVKVCVYAITADEPKEFIDRWVANMSGADYICVLVTKRANDNYFYLQEKQKLDEFKDKLIVDETGISPWRFDVARNESLKLVPEDSDVLICTDIDEVVDDRLWDDLRKCVFEHPNFERIFYRYAWSHYDNGEPKWNFWYDKIHKRKGWRWQYPVHEALTCDTPELYYGKYYLNSDIIYLHHWPDQTKSRGNYLYLLELRANECKNDLYGLYYLAREYSFIKDWKSALTTAYKLYVKLANGEFNDMRMISSNMCMLGDFSNNLNLKQDSEYWFKKAIANEPTLRDGYIKLAQLYAYSGKYVECYSLINDMLLKTQKVEDWRLSTYYWRDWKIYQILAVAKCWEQKYDEANQYFVKAFEDLKTEDDKVDALKEGLYTDFNWLLNHLNSNIDKNES